MGVNKKSRTKRLDGGKILIALTAQMERDIHSYCRDNKIESKSELVRQAVVAYIYKDYDDDTLKLSGLKDIRESLSQTQDMISVLFSYIDFMNLNTLAYYPEIPTDDLKKAAIASARNRHDKFFASFQERLKDDPKFFERLLHKYFTGALDE